MTKSCWMAVVEDWVLIFVVQYRWDADSDDGSKLMLPFILVQCGVCLLSFQISLNIPLFLWSVWSE